MGLGFQEWPENFFLTLDVYTVLYMRFADAQAP